MRAAELKVLILASGLFGRSAVGIEIDIPDLELNESKAKLPYFSNNLMYRDGQIDGFKVD